MLDIKLIREQPDFVRERLAARGKREAQRTKRVKKELRNSGTENPEFFS